MANMIPISTVTVGSGGSSTIQFSNIPQNYTDLKLIVSARMNYGSGINYSTFTVNSDSPSSLTYFKNVVTEGSATVSTYSQSSYGTGGEVTIGPAPGTSPIFNSFEIYMPNYSGATYKPYTVDLVNSNTLWFWMSGNMYYNTAPITSLKLYNSYNFSQYSSATLYGIRKY